MGHNSERGEPRRSEAGDLMPNLARAGRCGLFEINLHTPYLQYTMYEERLDICTITVGVWTGTSCASYLGYCHDVE